MLQLVFQSLADMVPQFPDVTFSTVQEAQEFLTLQRQLDKDAGEKYNYWVINPDTFDIVIDSPYHK